MRVARSPANGPILETRHPRHRGASHAYGGSIVSDFLSRGTAGRMRRRTRSASYARTATIWPWSSIPPRSFVSALMASLRSPRWPVPARRTSSGVLWGALFGLIFAVPVTGTGTVQTWVVSMARWTGLASTRTSAIGRAPCSASRPRAWRSSRGPAIRQLHSNDLRRGPTRCFASRCQLRRKSELVRELGGVPPVRGPITP